MIVQQVPFRDFESIYIIAFNKETDELTFRTSRVPEHKQTEKITRLGNDVSTHLYAFPLFYLDKFIFENN